MTYSYYSEEEKQIFEDHFLRHTDGHRIRYEQYVAKVIASHDPEKNLIIIDEKIKNPGKRLHARNQLRDQQATVRFDTHNVLWDKGTGDNLITHFLSQESFSPSSTALFDLNRVHPNWNHKNKNGDNPLMLLVKRGGYVLAKRLIADFPLDTDSKNKKGEYFTHLLFNPEFFSKPPHEDSIKYLVKVTVSFDKIFEAMHDYPHHFSDKKTLEKMVGEMDKINLIVNENIKGYSQHSLGYSIGKLEESRDILEKTLHNNYLQLALSVNDASKNKRPKL